MGGFLNVLGTLASPITGAIGAVGDILGGSMQQKAQESANATNLRIAQETNKANLDIANQNNAFTRMMFERNLQYNSPAEQRRMMAEAGYNPYSLYTNGQGAAAQSSSVPELQMGHQYAPTMIPEDGLGRNVAQVGNDLANMVSALSVARKNNSEANMNNVRLKTLGETLSAQLDSIGLGNEAQKIRNYVSEGTKDFDIERASKDIDYLNNFITLTSAQASNLHMRNELMEKYGDKFVDAQISEMINNAFRYAEEGKTEDSKRELNKALKGRADTQSWYDRYIAPHEAARMDASAEESRSRARNLEEERKYISMYAGNDVARTWNDALNGRANRQMLEKQKPLLEQALRKAIVDNDWNAVEHLTSTAKEWSNILRNMTKVD